MRHRTAVTVVALALAALTACGGGGGSAAAQPPTAAQVARQLGATGVQPVKPPTLYAYDEADATLNGRAVDIATFRSNDLRDKWVQTAKQFTGIEQTGDRYAVADG